MNNRQKLVQQQFLNNEEAVIKRLNKVYSQSSKDINDKIKNLTFKIGKLQQQYDWMDPDDPQRAKIKSQIQSKIYQKQYQEQLRSQVDGILKQMQTKSYLTVSDYLDDCYEDGFIGTIFDAHGQGVPILTPINQESMVRAVQLESKISQGLYTKLGEDVALLKRKIMAQVSRSISTDMTYAQTAQQLAGYTKIGYNNAVRIARTEGHRVQTTATMDAMTKARDKGADVLKQWDSTLDSRTRHSHAVVDGEIRELGDKFSNGLDYPGDPHGKAAEVINCRCALLQRASWALDDDELQTLKDRAEYFGLDKSDNFDDFKKKYLKATKEEKKQKATKSSFVPAKTIGEVNERVLNVLGSNTNLSGLDIDSANAYLEAVEQFTTEYPELKNYIQSIHTNVPLGLGGMYQQEYSLDSQGNWIVKNNLGLSKRITDKDISNQIARGELFEGQTRKDLAIHELTHALESKMANVKNGLYKNDSFVKVDGTKNSRIYANNNFAESITDRARAELYGDDFTNYFEDIKVLGGYAQYSDKEMIAQCIAYEMSGKTSRFSAKVKSIFDEEYKNIIDRS